MCIILLFLFWLHVVSGSHFFSACPPVGLRLGHQNNNSKALFKHAYLYISRTGVPTSENVIIGLYVCGMKRRTTESIKQQVCGFSHAHFGKMECLW